MKSKSTPIERKVALCYIRLSLTKDTSDLTSPQRQRANILAACEKNGWIPEWFEDTKGHKSATKEENRPSWLALKLRLRDPDVAALVVNEQSRAMRNAWRAIKLFEELPVYGVVLHLAALGRTIDITTPDGRMSAYIQAFLDDLYALDASRRAKDSARYRKAKGVSQGLPPFGTVRDAHGYLTASPLGAWLLPDGNFVAGKDKGQSPHPDAIWRGYFECARTTLELYATNQHGYIWLAEEMNQQGWAFKDRWNQPRPFNGDDIRRIASNWREYAGIVQDGRAKERIANQIEQPVSALIDTGRAVFPLELLHDVARTQEARSVTTRPTGSVRQAHIFSLSFLLYCSYCDQLAMKDSNLKLRTRIIGHKKNDELRYRHSDSRRCGCNTKSVFIEVVERDFAQLIATLDVHPEAIQAMAQLAVQRQFANTKKEPDLAKERALGIAKHQRALKNNLILFQNGDVEADEYFRQKDYHERQIAYWQAQTDDHEKVTVELVTTVEMLKRLKTFWDIAEGEDRRLLAHSLFDEIVYDLEKRQIVSFKLKAWAEPFLVLRAALYHDHMAEEMKNRFNSGVSSGGQFHDPTGIRTLVFTLKG